MKLADLVSQLQRLAPHLDPAYLRRQVRAWTSAGLVGEEDELHDRPRRHRKYDTRHLYRAALLVELATYGIPQRIMQTVVQELVQKSFEYRDKYGTDPFEDAVEGTGVFLIFYFFRGRSGGLGASLEIGRTKRDELITPFPTSWITIDLNRVLAHVN